MTKIPCPFLPSDTDEQRDGGSSSSDSDTDGEDTQQTRRLTPATMVNRYSQSPRSSPSPYEVALAPKTGSKQSPIEMENDEREKGNTKFGKGDFEGAVKSYTR